jgi:hypothetical protein
MLPRSRAAVALVGLSALTALAVATPAGALGTQANPTPTSTPTDVPSGTATAQPVPGEPAPAPGVVTGATPASPIAAQPDFAG